jgi:hypothetical protein
MLEYRADFVLRWISSKRYRDDLSQRSFRSTGEFPCCWLPCCGSAAADDTIASPKNTIRPKVIVTP